MWHNSQAFERLNLPQGETEARNAQLRFDVARVLAMSA